MSSFDPSDPEHSHPEHYHNEEEIEELKSRVAALESTIKELLGNHGESAIEDIHYHLRLLEERVDKLEDTSFGNYLRKLIDNDKQREK